MLSIVEKKSFIIEPCRVNKELVRKINSVVGQLKSKYVLYSKTREIRSTNAELFFGLDWPSEITEIRIEGLGPLGSVKVLFRLDSKNRGNSTVEVRGSDLTWVEGVATQLRAAFEAERLWFCPRVLAKYRLARMSLSLAVISLFVWRVYRSVAPIVSATLPFAEGYFFLLLLLPSLIVGTYPSYCFLTWLFPLYELDKKSQRTVQKGLGSLLAVVVVWILTNWLFPALIP